MKLIIKLILLFTLPLHCFSQKSKAVDCDSFYNLLNDNTDIMLFDIRVLDKFKESRIQDAYWGGTKENLKPLLKSIKNDTPIFLYCEIGKRSKECSKWLLSLGYKKIYELKGGIREWKKNGFPLDSSTIALINTNL